ncbi:hypothetical protein [Pseudoxanthomonas japonensis]|uniref:hypothetical protein n=1 Tax=Pseudoxanthomonas japonensis TaxID=69284 RepID=UPI0013911C0E|nr:hypothetical protein [Pseudoxanthomonas japonensis]
MRLFPLACLLVPASVALAGEPASFAGDYGHGATHDADEVVWRVQDTGTGWRLTSTGDGGVVDAHRLDRQGRTAFWNRMGWPADSSRDADCLTWGEKPASLDDLLADTPPAPVAAGGDYGLGVLCRVPLAARIQTGWLGDQASDWFYYDPVAGVMEARRLR